MNFIIDALSWGCLILGSFLGISGAVGIFSFKEFYSRVQAASVTDTLCVFFIMLGLILQSGFNLVSVKLIIAVGLLWLTGPLATHALVRSAYLTGLKPKLSFTRKESSKRGQS